VPCRIACFASHVIGEQVLEKLLRLPELVEVVLVATDDPLASYSNAHLRIWKYSEGRELDRLARLVPERAAKVGLAAFTSRVREAGGEFHRMFEEASPDAIVSAVFGQRLPKHLLEAVGGNAWNLHYVVPGRPLSDTRGGQSIETAYRLGATSLQLTLHRMGEDYDDGPEVARSEPFALPPIGPSGPGSGQIAEIQRAAAPLGAQLVVTHLPALLEATPARALA